MLGSAKTDLSLWHAVERHSVRSMNILVNLTYRPLVLGCYLALCIMAARSTALWAVEPETYIDQGLAKAEAGNHAGAIEDFSRAIKLNPSLPMAYLARAQSRVAKAEYRDAIKDYSRAIRLNNANAAAYLNRGQAHGMLKEYQAELDDSSQAIKIAPGYAEAYVNRGVAKTKLHDLRGAEGDFEHAIRLKPDLVASYYLLGIVRVMLGEARRGVDDYAKAMRLASGSPINDFSEAIKQDPKDPDPYVGRGLVYYVLRNKPATTNDFDQAARLRPMLQSDLKRLLNDPSVAWIQK